MAKKNIENSICFPGEDAWELWVSKENRFGSSDYELTETKEVDDSGSCEPFKVATHYASVSYTHLTLPTNREV